MAKCPKCGKDSPDQARFCRSCGAPLAANGRSAAAPPGGTPEQRAQRLLEEAFRLSEESRVIAAIQACQQAVTVNPNSVSAHSLLATLYERQGDREAAIREYEQVLTLSPESTVERRRLNELMGLPTAREGVRVSIRTVQFAIAGGAGVVALVLLVAILFYTQQGPSRPAGPKLPPGTLARGGAGPGVVQAEVVPAPGRTFTLGRFSALPATPVLRPRRGSGGMGAAIQAPRDQLGGRWVGPGTYLLPNTGLGPGYGGAAARPRGGGVAAPVVGAVPYQGTPVVATPALGPPQGMNRARASASRQRARDYYFAGDYTRAIEAYQSYLAQQPQAGAPAREELAWVYVESGSKGQAAGEYQSALREYQADLQRGHNVEAARHGIRTCESAIRALEPR